MTIFRRLFSMLALLTLAACGGGGGDSGTPSFGSNNPTPGPTAADLVLEVPATISNSGTDSAAITVTAVDANRQTVQGVTIALTTADGDVVLSIPSGSVTGAAGTVQASLRLGANRSNRVIAITATAGSVTKTANLNVVTTSPDTPTAAGISLTLSAATLPNSGSASVVATVTAVDVNRNTISGIPVTIAVDNDATVLVSASTTNVSGVVTGTINIGANKANRVIRVTATSGTLSQEATMQVTGTRINATALPAVLAAGQPGKVQYKATDASNQPMAGLSIAVSSAGTQTAAKTDNNGFYEYTYLAPAADGNLDILASAGGVNTLTTVIVQSGAGSIPAVPAGSVRSNSVSANPSVLSINEAGKTDNRAEIRALFVGDNNQPIKNIRVRFDLNGDVNSIGGSFSSGNTVIYSDANGVALASYISGTRSSPTNGLTVRACWDYDEFAAGDCPHAATASLTVISEPLSVTIGTDNLVKIEDLVYVQRFVVQVNDSSGLAKADVIVSPLLDLDTYSQGYWVYDKINQKWFQNVTASRCDNEDVNRNGVLEVYSTGDREDANSNGQLDPRKADVVVAYEGSNLTDKSGQVKFRIIYPQNLGSWATYKLTVAATGVSGTEGRAAFSGTLVVPITVVKAEAEPPFVLSPYGQTDGLPRVIVTTPDGRASASLCSK